MRAEPWDFLEKPFAGDELLDVVRRGIETRQLSLEKQSPQGRARSPAVVLKEECLQPSGPRLLSRPQAADPFPRSCGNDPAYQPGRSRRTACLAKPAPARISWPAPFHERSARRNHPFMAINCGAVPEKHHRSRSCSAIEKGAFTGAGGTANRQIRTLPMGGTVIFWMRSSPCPLALQVKLLRVLQDATLSAWGPTRRYRSISG